MKEVDKCEPCHKISRAYPGKTWDSLVKMFNESETFRKDWDKTTHTFETKGDDIERFLREVGLMSHQKTGISMEMWYWFLTVSQFLKKYKMEPKAIKVQVTIMKDERGVQSLKGVLVQPSDDDHEMMPYRRVRFFSETAWFISETLCGDSQRLREDQPMDGFKHMNSKKATEHKALT